MDYMTEVQKALDAIRNAMETLRPLITSGLQVPQKQRIEKALTELINASTTLEFQSPSEEREAASESRHIPGSVRQIDVSGAVNVTVRSGAEPGLTVYASRQDDLKKVLTTISRGCLTIDSEPTIVVTSNRSGSKQVFHGPVGMVAGGDIIKRGRGDTLIHVAGSIGQIVGDVQGDYPGCRVEVTLPHVTDLCVSGAGNVSILDLDQDAIHLDVSGAGSIAATGTVTLLHAIVSGAGNIGGYELTSTDAHLDVSGAGSIKAMVTQSVHAGVSGVGKIKIAGNPGVRDTNVTGLGKIKFVDRER
jgi:hypothetical protein